MFLKTQIRRHNNSYDAYVSTGLNGVRAKLDCWATTIEFTQTVLGTRPQEFRLLCILLETVCRHPVIVICDTVFKFPNSSQRIIATTTLIQLRIVSKSVIVDAVLISLRDQQECT